jgi:hypothetical protein
LRKAQANLVAARRDSGLAQQGADRRRRDGVGGQRGELLHHLYHRPVCDPVPVGETTTADDARLHAVERLRDQARLAEAGLADHRHQLAPHLRARPLPRVRQPPKLLLATDEARGVAPLGHVQHGDQPERRDRLGFPFQLQRLHRLHVDRRRHQRVRRSADQHLTRLGRLLEAGGDIHRVAGGECLVRGRHHHAGIDADPAAQAELRQRVTHLDRSAAGPQRIVLAHHRNSEHRHHRVTDELLHRAAVPLDDRPHPLEVARQQSAQDLRIDRFAQRRRPRQVAEHRRHRLTQLAHRLRLRHRDAT